MNVTIESMIDTCNNDTLLSFAQLIHIGIHCTNETELRDTVKSLPYISFAHHYFAWGFGSKHFWVKQRKTPKSTELNDNRILIVTF